MRTSSPIWMSVRAVISAPRFTNTRSPSSMRSGNSKMTPWKQPIPNRTNANEAGETPCGSSELAARREGDEQFLSRHLRRRAHRSRTRLQPVRPSTRTSDACFCRSVVLFSGAPARCRCRPARIASPALRADPPTRRIGLVKKARPRQARLSCLLCRDPVAIFQTHTRMLGGEGDGCMKIAPRRWRRPHARHVQGTNKPAPQKDANRGLRPATPSGRTRQRPAQILAHLAQAQLLPWQAGQPL